MATFVAVVENGSFAAAARYLSIAPATVTLQIQSLEHRIGARLLQRTTRKSTLTEAGEEFYRRSCKVLIDINEANAMARDLGATAKGTLRLNTSPSLTQDVTAIIAKYSAAHPEMLFDLTTTRECGGLIESRVDLAIRDDAVADSSLIARRLTEVEWVPCASPGYVDRNGTPQHPRNLGEHNCLIYASHQTRADEWHFEGDERAVANVSGNLRSSDPHAIRSASLCDLGIALLPPSIVARDLIEGRLIRILHEFSAPRTTVLALYPSREYLAHKVRSFIDFAAASFSARTARDKTTSAYSDGSASGLRVVLDTQTFNSPFDKHNRQTDNAHSSG